MEEWKNIVGFENYQISNLGNVKNLNWRGIERILKNQINKEGYLNVGLRKNKKIHTTSIHRLVALHFIENPLNLLIVNHKDSNRSNPHYKNLEWCTHSYNLKYSYDNGNFINPNKNKFGKDHHSSKVILQYDLEMNFIKEWASTMDIERELGFKHSGISKCCLGQLKTSHKFIWKFK